jgi:hypothetical protein
MNKSNNKSFNSPLHLILEVAHAHTALQETVVNAVAEAHTRNLVAHHRFVILLM